MKELPTPTFPLSPAFLVRSSSFLGIARVDEPQRTPAPQPASQAEEHPQTGGITAVWARHLDEVREAQRLRFDVFAGEMGARLETSTNTVHPGHDIDMFDDFCEHLLVRDKANGQVVGTYRVLTPAQAKRIGTTYTDTEFDLTRLRSMRERMVELAAAACTRTIATVA